jgi:hypothetical protein
MHTYVCHLLANKMLYPVWGLIEQALLRFDHSFECWLISNEIDHLRVQIKKCVWICLFDDSVDISSIVYMNVSHLMVGSNM